jgi:hypothetical protein
MNRFCNTSFDCNYCFTERNGKTKIRKRKLDFTGLLMNFLGLSILLLSLSSFVIVFLDMDAIHVFIPTSYLNQPGVILLRIVLQTIGELDWVATIGQIHLVHITAILHIKSIFGELAVLEKRQVFSKNTTKRNNGSEKPNGVYSKFGDLQLYSLANYFFTIVNKDIGFTVVFILVPGFAVDVAANYMILKMFDEFPIYFYAFACLLAGDMQTNLELWFRL